MFCSNCGKSLLPEEASCRHCGAHYGKERFYGNTYTSAQVRIPASQLNDAPAGGRIAYTKVDYFDQQPDDDIYSNTAYRPLLSREDDLNRIEEREAEEEARLQAEEDARRAEEEMRAEEQRARQTRTEEEQIEEQTEETVEQTIEQTIEEAIEETVEEEYAEDQFAEEPEYARQDADEYNQSEYAEGEYAQPTDENEYDAAYDAAEDTIEDIPEDDPLPDDLPDAVISDTVRAHMEKQRQDEARRAAAAERMAPFVNLTQKLTPGFLRQGDANVQGGEAGSARSLFDFFGKKNAPAVGEEAEAVQEEYADAEYTEGEEKYADAEYTEGEEEYADTEYTEGEEEYADTEYTEGEEEYADTEYTEGEEEYADAEYTEGEEEYADTEYTEGEEEYADAEYAEDEAEYTDTEYTADEEEYTDAEYADDGFVYDEAQGEYTADENDEFSEFEDGTSDESKFKFDLNAILERFNINVDIKELIKNRAVTIAVAAALIVAVIIGGIAWLNFITQQRPKVANVTYETYQQGIEMLTANSGEEYRTEMTQTYLSNSSFANTAFTEDMQAFNALLPASPLENDQLFIAALTNIQDVIAETIKEDADAQREGTAAQRAAVSEQKWQAIRNAVEKLSKASTAAELSVIVSDLKLLTAPTPSPSPSPTPKVEYETLTNGMRDSVPVKRLQLKLIELGFLSGEADGDFGNGTESAVKAFQRAAGLTETGVVTPDMQELLYEGNPPSVNSAATSAPSNPAGQD